MIVTLSNLCKYLLAHGFEQKRTTNIDCGTKIVHEKFFKDLTNKQGILEKIAVDVSRIGRGRKLVSVLEYSKTPDCYVFKYDEDRIVMYDLCPQQVYDYLINNYKELIQNEGI